MTNTYTTITGDMWDGIAYKVYGDSSHMHTLLEANREHVETVVFPAGIKITVPEVEQTTAEDLPPWKRR